MSEESSTTDVLARMREGFDALNRRDWDAVMQPYGVDSTFQSLPLGVKVVGPTAIRGFAEDWLGAYEEVELAIDQLVDLGGGVTFAVIRQKARPFGAGEWVEQRDAWVTEWDRGVIMRATAYADVDEARAAAERLAQERQ